MSLTRPNDLLEALGIDYKGLNEDGRAMRTLLAEEYKRHQKNPGVEIKKWRENHPSATFGDAIRALYEELEG